MHYRRLGDSGLKVSAISLGSWLTFGQSVDDETTEACMAAAYDAGVNFFDGAEAYGPYAAEEAMGRVLRKKGWPRDSLILSGKVSIRCGRQPTQRGLSRKHLVECCDATCRRLGVEYLDLFFCHRPDPDTPLEEIVHTMNELIRRGRIFYWGTSEFEPADLMRMHAIAEKANLVGPLMEQTGHNMLGRERVERDLLPLLTGHGMGTTIYCPLAGGILTGKYNEGIPDDSRIGQSDQDWLKKSLTEEKLAKARALADLAGEMGLAMPTLALAWCLRNPHVSTAITGATKPEHVTENVKAPDAVEQLTDDVMARIEDILANKP